mgnify:CR=1 FL=1
MWNNTTNSVVLFIMYYYTYNVVKCNCWLNHILFSTNYLYNDNTKRCVSLTFYTSFWWFYLSNINLLYCYTRTTILAKIVISVHYSLFSIKVCLIHLNMNNKSALKGNLLKFINMYCKCCMYGNVMWIPFTIALSYIFVRFFFCCDNNPWNTFYCNIFLVIFYYYLLF